MTDYYVSVPEKQEIYPRELYDLAHIPGLPASKIRRGIINPDRIPDIDASKITGLLDAEQIPQIDASKLVGTIEDGRIPSTIARVGETESGAVAAHEAAADPHPQYARDSDLAAAIASLSAAAHTHPYPFFDGQNWRWKQNQRPSFRPDNSALAVGDEWFDTVDRMLFFWNGSYWLSDQLFAGHNSFSAYGSTFAMGLLPINPSYNLWLERFSVIGNVGTPNDSSNYWNLQLTRSGTASDTVLSTFDTRTTGTNIFNFGANLNLHLAAASLGAISLRSLVTRISAPGTLNSTNFRITFRLAKI